MAKSPSKKAKKTAPPLPPKPDEPASTIDLEEDHNVPSNEREKDTGLDDENTSIASSLESSSKTKTKGNGNGKGTQAAANKAAGYGTLNDPLLTEEKLESELEALMKLTKKGADTAHLQLDLLMDMLHGLIRSPKPDLIKDRMIAKFINITLKSTTAKKIRQFLALLLAKVLEYNQSHRANTTVKSNMMYTMLSCAIRLCICSDAAESAHEDALESENKRFKRISSNGTRLIPSGTINETTDLPELIRALELALELRIAWQKTLSFKFRKPNSPDPKTYHVYEFPKFADDKAVIDYALKKHKFESNSRAYEASLSIYKAIDQCLSKGLRKRLMLYKDIVGHSGPKLIIVLFKLLHTNTEDILRITSLFFSDLERTMQECNWNIIDMSVVIMENLIDLKNAGGNIIPMHDQVTQCFGTMPNDNYKTHHNQYVLELKNSYDGTSVLSYLQAASGWVKTLITQGKWHHSEGAAKVPAPAKKGLNNAGTSAVGADVTAFKAEIEEMKEANMKLKKDLKASQASYHNAVRENNKRKYHDAPHRDSDKKHRYRGHSTPLPPPRDNDTTSHHRRDRAKGKDHESNYGFGSWQWGHGCFYDNEKDFNQFWYGFKTKDPCTVNGRPWYWCAKCNRMGNHATTEHRDRNKYPAPDRNKDDDRSSRRGHSSYLAGRSAPQGSNLSEESRYMSEDSN